MLNQIASQVRVSRILRRSLFCAAAQLLLLHMVPHNAMDDRCLAHVLLEAVRKLIAALESATERVEQGRLLANGRIDSFNCRKLPDSEIAPNQCGQLAQ